MSRLNANVPREDVVLVELRRARRAPPAVGAERVAVEAVERGAGRARARAGRRAATPASTCRRPTAPRAARARPPQCARLQPAGRARRLTPVRETLTPRTSGAPVPPSRRAARARRARRGRLALRRLEQRPRPCCHESGRAERPRQPPPTQCQRAVQTPQDGRRAPRTERARRSAAASEQRREQGRACPRAAARRARAEPTWASIAARTRAVLVRAPASSLDVPELGRFLRERASGGPTIRSTRSLRHREPGRVQARRRGEPPHERRRGGSPAGEQGHVERPARGRRQDQRAASSAPRRRARRRAAADRERLDRLGLEHTAEELRRALVPDLVRRRDASAPTSRRCLSRRRRRSRASPQPRRRAARNGTTVSEQQRPRDEPAALDVALERAAPDSIHDAIQSASCTAGAPAARPRAAREPPRADRHCAREARPGDAAQAVSMPRRACAQRARRAAARAPAARRAAAPLPRRA